MTDRANHDTTAAGPADDWDRLKDLVADALDLPGAEREGFLLEQCADAPDLLAQARDLVLTGDEATGFLASPPTVAGPLASPGDAQAAAESLVGETIGGFSIQERIASGGMGTVYRALQERTGQTVALKVLHALLPGDGWQQRFDHEVHILAQLHHEAIGQLFDAGTQEVHGRTVQYFAMEFVDGLPLTRFVEQQDLTPREIVQLMVRVCEGVHHAHQRGVIHRDLKPDNILVSRRDPSLDGTRRDTELHDIGQPKILDFGIARAAGPDDVDTTRLTQAGQMIGTLAYMSPEQVAGRAEDIDVRSDVYALGMILFEALTGQRAYDSSGRSLPEAARMVLETEPRRLSALQPRLGGDLDIIVATTLHKDREQRYASTSELAADLKRYLDDEAILARPPSAAYQLRKFARRNRGLVAGLAIALLAILAGAAGTVWGWLDALHQEGLARAAATTAQTERDRALQAEDEAKEVVAFLEAMVDSADVGSIGRRLTVQELLDLNGPKIDEAFPDKPGVRAKLHSSFGWDYCTLGDYEKSDRHLSESIALLEQLRGPEHVDTIAERSRLAHVLVYRADRERAQPLIERNVEIAIRALGPEHEQTLHALEAQANWLHHDGDYAGAERIYRRVAAEHERLTGLRNDYTLGALVGLGNALQSLGRYAEAREQYERIYEVRLAAHGLEHTRTLLALTNLAGACSSMGEHDAALTKFETVLRIGPQVWGNDHPDLRAAKGNYAAALHEAHRIEESIQANRDLYTERCRFEGEQHPDTLRTLNNMCTGLMQLKRYEEAEPWINKLLAATIATRGEDDAHTARVLGMQIETLARRAKHLPLAQRAAMLSRCTEQYERILVLYDRHLGEKHPDTIIMRNNFGVFLLKQAGNPARAVPVMQRVVTDWLAVMPDAKTHLRVLRMSLAKALMGADRGREAEAEFLRAWALPSHPLATDQIVAERLEQLYASLGQPAEAEVWRNRRE